MIKILGSACLLALFLSSCGDDEMLIPKPPTYLRTDFPEHQYVKVNDAATYSFELSKVYSQKPLTYKGEITNHKEVNLGPLNGTLYLNYYPIPNRDTLVRYINLSNDKVDEHQIKATRIKDQNFLFKDKKVYGTLFEFEGDVATNYQFYLTDSVSHFIRGEVLMNCRPNYDSLRPTLNYLKVDLLHLIETFEWKK
jgi:gliding motility-associated lipoprotein GldD